MRFRNFREFKIIRNCEKNYKHYSNYKPYLQVDFHNRCAYCNLLDTQITTPFETDHFIPENTFKGIRPDLACCYENLVYSCKKCNDAKSDQFEGDINLENPENIKFYNPVKIDYNEIFYRSEIGAIASDDPKGLQMIADLQLYRPIHNLAWLCEETGKILDKINEKLKKESSPLKKELLQRAKETFNDYYIECTRSFISNYNNKRLKIDVISNLEVISSADRLMVE